ncbi:MAG: hypothetical protein ACRDBQ_23175 [Shewanella sp.]
MSKQTIIDPAVLGLKNDELIAVLGCSRAGYFSYKKDPQITPPYIIAHFETLKALKLVSEQDFKKRIEAQKK